MTRTDKEEDVRMRKRICRRTEKDEKEEEASKCYFRNSLCSLVTEEEKDDDSMGRRRTEKVLYRDKVDEDCQEKDCGGGG